MASSRQIEQAAAAWLARRESGAWAGADQAGLDAWLAESTAHRVAFLRLESAWNESGRLAALGAGQTPGAAPPRGQWTASPLDRAASPRTAPAPPASAPAGGPPDLARLVFAPRERERSPRWPRLAAGMFAGMLVMAGAGWGAHHYFYGVVEQASYATALGDLDRVPLSDGSGATLSSDSRIAVSLSRRERHIDLLRGEAFFEAAKDPRRPFVVSAGPRQVVAVGTRFAVRRDGPDLRVVVTEGTVRLEASPDADGHPQPTTLLPAGSLAIASRNGVVVRTGSVADAERLVDWRSGFVTFRDTSLAEAASEFNRYNARKIVMGDPAVGALRVGGNFRWSNVDAFVRLLEQGFPVRAEAGTDRVVLHSL
ncbi:FecR family protein [Pseudoxanthomonas beigongshangi]